MSHRRPGAQFGPTLVQLIDEQGLGTGDLAEMFGVSRRTIQVRVKAARAAKSAASSLTAGDRRHLSRTYGRSKDPAVQEWLRKQARPSA